ncbi:MAG: hypothetical protein ACRC68_03440 [Clostridium sp.]
MSKRRDKSKSQECQCAVCQNKSNKASGGLGENPFGINPSQLMGMLGNIDIAQIGNIISSMNKDGFDLNNLNLGAIQNMMPGSNQNGINQNNQELNPMQKMMANMGVNENQGMASLQNIISSMGNSQLGQNNMKHKKSGDIRPSNENEHKTKKTLSTEVKTETLLDENIEMLISLRKIVNDDKAKFIDKIIELYNNGVFEED